MSLPQLPQQNISGNRFIWERQILFSTLPSHLKLLALALLNFADSQGGSIFPGVRMLRGMVGRSESIVRSSLAELRKLGLFREVAERRVDPNGNIEQRPIREGAGPKGGYRWTVVYQFDPVALTRVRPAGGLSPESPPAAETQGSGFGRQQGSGFELPSDQYNADQNKRSGSHNQRARECQRQQEALEDQAAGLILDLTPAARGVLEAEVLASLEPYRARNSAASFDDLVLRALPGELIRYARGRSLHMAVADLEAKFAVLSLATTY